MKKKLIFTIILIIYLIIAFGTEALYRNKLYEISVEYIEKIKQEGFFHIFYFFWSMIFLYFMIIIGMLVTLFFYPINTFFTYVSIQLILIFIMCILKSLYSQQRPFWDIYLKKGNETHIPSPTECDGEFGNPSGHSLLSTYILCLWDLFLYSGFFNKIEGKKKIFIKYFTLFLSIICIIFITYSRVNRQIHSFNQIIFGTILGLSVYFIFCHILEINKTSTEKFFIFLDNFKYYLIPICILLYTISLILGLTIHNEKEKEYEAILERYCNYVKEQLFGKNTGLNSSLIFNIVGGYIGLLFLNYKINKFYPDNKNIFYNWNKGKKLNTFKIVLFSFLLPTILPALVSLIPHKYYVLKVVLNNIFFLLYGFLSMGLCFYYGCVLFKKSEISNEEKLLISNEEEKNI